MLSRQANLVANIVIGLVLAAVAVGAFVISEIRVGGPMSRANTLHDEMLADILPPPCFVVEAYLMATLITSDPASAAPNVERLKALKAEFIARKAYWAESALPDRLHSQMQATIAAADAFWKAVDRDFLPAYERRDQVAMRAALNDHLAPHYARQSGEVLSQVAMAKSVRADTDSRNGLIVSTALAAIGILALMVVGALILAARFVRRDVAAPVAHMANVLGRMAHGDYDCELAAWSRRRDEIGTMAEAAETFRMSAIARHQLEADQRQVVGSLSVALQHLSDRDLEYRIQDRFSESYEALRNHFNATVQALAETLHTVRAGVGGVMNNLAQLQTSSTDLSDRNCRQAESLAETASTVHHVSANVHDTAGRASGAQQAIALAHDKASEGGDVVRRAIEAMDSIQSSSREISEIVNVIDAIAFQTNLLALNAGVEAARAGSAGSGFAVVANEVRALAQRSADAASNIKTLIETSSGHVGRGVALVGETGAKLTEIVDQVGSVSRVIGEIASAAETQARSLAQISESVSDIDRITQQNSAMVEETTAATTQLAAEVRTVGAMLAQFRTRNLATRPAYVANPDALRRKSIASAHDTPLALAG